jgi:hypothetical protein|tara:strand:- start:42279 stop:42521 length:243 start_codon:yes stop_codon:yes gene_type:complete
MKKTKLEEFKENAPEIPTNTCPYIDFIQEILKEIGDESDSIFIEKKIELADSMLEYIREANDSLRKGSIYWYQKCNQSIK